MLRNLASVMIAVSLSAAASAEASVYGTAVEAKAMLDRAIAAVKENEFKALDMFNKGEGGFKDRDLYVLCANASDGIITASPTSKGAQLKDFPSGQKVMRTASEGTVERDYLFVAAPRLDQAAGETHVLHKGRRPNLRGRLLQMKTPESR